MEDDPDFDGTDFAHPAWWRGQDSGIANTVRVVNDILDGPRKGGTFGYPPLEELRQRLYKLMEK